jgi:tetratricopeptide (TPR) repeat protein
LPFSLAIANIKAVDLRPSPFIIENVKRKKVPPRRIERAVNITQLVANLIAIIGVAAGGYFWFNNALAAHIENSLQPYTGLIGANASLAAEHYEDAIASYKNCFQQLKPHLNDAANQHLMAVLCTSYLHAIASCHEPTKHTAEFNTIVKLFGDGLLTADSADWFYIGWYDFWTGDKNGAQKAFTTSAQLDIAEDDEESSADGIYGLCFLALAEGDPNVALAHLKTAAERAPTNYSEFYEDPSSWSNRKAERLYHGKFALALEALNQQLPVSVQPSGPFIPTERHRARNAKP